MRNVILLAAAAFLVNSATAAASETWSDIGVAVQLEGLTWAAGARPPSDLACQGAPPNYRICTPAATDIWNASHSRSIEWARSLRGARSFGALDDAAFTAALHEGFERDDDRLQADTERAIRDFVHARRLLAVQLAFVRAARAGLQAAMDAPGGERRVASLTAADLALRRAIGTMAGRGVAYRCDQVNRGYRAASGRTGDAIDCAVPLPALRARVGATVQRTAAPRVSPTARAGTRTPPASRQRSGAYQGVPILRNWTADWAASSNAQADATARDEVNHCGSAGLWNATRCAADRYFGVYQNVVTVPFYETLANLAGPAPGDTAARITPVVQIAPHMGDARRATDAFLARPSWDTFGGYALSEAVLAMDMFVGGAVVRSVAGGLARGAARRAVVSEASVASGESAPAVPQGWRVEDTALGMGPAHMVSAEGEARAIGAGMYGTVMEHPTRPDVILKVLRPWYLRADNFDDAAVLGREDLRLRALADADSAPRPLGHMRVEGRLVTARERVDGRTIQSLAARGEFTPERQRLVGDLADRLARAGVLPGDLHPGNIMIGRRAGDAADSALIVDTGEIRDISRYSLERRRAMLDAHMSASLRQGSWLTDLFGAPSLDDALAAIAGRPGQRVVVAGADALAVARAGVRPVTVYHGGGARGVNGWFFATDDYHAASIYASRRSAYEVRTFSFRFARPLEVQGTGGLLHRLIPDMDEFLIRAARDGHDGVIFRNVIDQPGNLHDADPITVFVALDRRAISAGTTSAR